MTNLNVQSPLPLNGPGFVRRINGGYAPGEMKRLLNCEFLDNVIVSRRTINCTFGSGGTRTPTRFIGEIGGNPVLGIAHVTAGAAIVKTTAVDTLVTLPTSGTIGALTGYRVSIECAVEYRGYNYFVCVETPDATLTDSRVAIYKTLGTNLDAGAGVTRTVIVTFPAAKLGVLPGDVHGGFMHKERLWISINSTVYWSMATDPMTWTPPNGGFAVMDVSTITDMIALNDTIYIAGFDVVYTLSYSVDIETELVIRAINSSFGVHSFCVFRGTIYGVNQNGVFRFQGINVEKLVDIPAKYPYRFKIVSHDAYIYILTYYPSRIDSQATPTTDGRYLQGRYPNNAGILGFTNAPSVFCFNMDTGCMSEMLTNDNVLLQNLIADMTVITDTSGNSVLFMTSNVISGTAVGGNVITSDGRCYYTHAGLDRLGYDSYGNSYRIPYNIEWDSFCPEGNEHLMKKFRQMLVEGSFPGGTSDSLKCAVAFDNRAYKAPVNFEDANVSTSRPPYPHRMGLNQRARSISINIYNADLRTILSGANPTADQRFEITDVRMLWSYTQRVLETAEQSKSA